MKNMINAIITYAIFSYLLVTQIFTKQIKNIKSSINENTFIPLKLKQSNFQENQFKLIVYIPKFLGKVEDVIIKYQILGNSETDINEEYLEYENNVNIEHYSEYSFYLNFKDDNVKYKIMLIKVVNKENGNVKAYKKNIFISHPSKLVMFQKKDVNDSNENKKYYLDLNFFGKEKPNVQVNDGKKSWNISNNQIIFEKIHNSKIYQLLFIFKDFSYETTFQLNYPNIPNNILQTNNNKSKIFHIELKYFHYVIEKNNQLPLIFSYIDFTDLDNKQFLANINNLSVYYDNTLINKDNCQPYNDTTISTYENLMKCNIDFDLSKNSIIISEGLFNVTYKINVAKYELSFDSEQSICNFIFDDPYDVINKNSKVYLISDGKYYSPKSNNTKAKTNKIFSFKIESVKNYSLEINNVNEIIYNSDIFPSASNLLPSIHHRILLSNADEKSLYKSQSITAENLNFVPELPECFLISSGEAKFELTFGEGIDPKCFNLRFKNSLINEYLNKEDDTHFKLQLSNKLEGTQILIIDNNNDVYIEKTITFITSPPLPYSVMYPSTIFFTNVKCVPNGITINDILISCEERNLIDETALFPCSFDKPLEIGETYDVKYAEQTLGQVIVSDFSLSREDDISLIVPYDGIAVIKIPKINTLIIESIVLNDGENVFEITKCMDKDNKKECFGKYHDEENKIEGYSDMFLTQKLYVLNNFNFIGNEIRDIGKEISYIQCELKTNYVFINKKNNNIFSNFSCETDINYLQSFTIDETDLTYSFNEKGNFIFNGILNPYNHQKTLVITSKKNSSKEFPMNILFYNTYIYSCDKSLSITNEPNLIVNLTLGYSISSNISFEFGIKVNNNENIKYKNVTLDQKETTKEILLETNIQSYDNNFIVVKYGDNILFEEEISKESINDFLSIKVDSLLPDVFYIKEKSSLEVSTNISILFKENSISFINKVNKTKTTKEFSCRRNDYHYNLLNCIDVIFDEIGEYEIQLHSLNKINQTLNNVSLLVTDKEICNDFQLKNETCKYCKDIDSNKPYLNIKGDNCTKTCSIFKSDGNGNYRCLRKCEGNFKYSVSIGKSTECLSKCDEDNGYGINPNQTNNQNEKTICILCKEKYHGINSYGMCDCLPGYKLNGNFCEEINTTNAIDECKSFYYCSNGGICEMKTGFPVCDCPLGFYGKRCEITYDTRERIFDSYVDEIKNSTQQNNKEYNLTVAYIKSVSRLLLQDPSLIDLIDKDEMLNIIKQKIVNSINVYINSSLHNKTLDLIAFIQQTLELINLDLLIQLTNNPFSIRKLNSPFKSYNANINETLQSSNVILKQILHLISYYQPSKTSIPILSSETNHIYFQSVNSSNQYIQYANDSIRHNLPVFYTIKNLTDSNQTSIGIMTFNLPNEHLTYIHAYNKTTAIFSSYLNNVNLSVLFPHYNDDLYKFYISKGIDIYNKSDKAFTDKCFLSTNFTYDLTQRYRKKYIYAGYSLINNENFNCVYKKMINNTYGYMNIQCDTIDTDKGIVLDFIKEPILKSEQRHDLAIRCHKHIQRIDKNVAFIFYGLFFVVCVIIEVLLLVIYINKIFKSKKSNINHNNSLHSDNSNSNHDNNRNNKNKWYNREEQNEVYPQNRKCLLVFFRNVRLYHPILMVFKNHVRDPQVLNYYFFMFNIFCLFGFPALFYTEKRLERRIHSAYRDSFFFGMRYHFGNVVLLTIFATMGMNLLFRGIMIIPKKCMHKPKTLYTFNKIFFCQRIVGVVLMFGFMIFLWYYAIVWCGIYINAQYQWLFMGIWSVVWVYFVFSILYIGIVSIIQVTSKKYCPDVVYYMKRLMPC